MMANRPDDPSSPATQPRRAPGTGPRFVFRALRFVCLGYLVIVVLMMWFERLLVYPTWLIPRGDWNPTGFSFEDVRFSSADGTSLHGWYFEHSAARAHVVYCHGNGEDVAGMGEYMDLLRSRYRISIFVFDFRGYGRSEGRPAEAGIVEDGKAAQRWLADRVGLDPNRILLWGRSIGGAIAVQLAADQGARGVILERTFTSLPDVAARHYPWLPVRRLMRNRFDSLARAQDYSGPWLQSHGTADEVVPIELGIRLFKAAAANPKRWVAMEGVTHNGPNAEDYYTELHRFIEHLP